MRQLKSVNIIYFTVCRLEEIGASATKEYSLEKAMEKMGAEWQEMEFIFLEYRDTVSSQSWPIVSDLIIFAGYLHIVSC